MTETDRMAGQVLPRPVKDGATSRTPDHGRGAAASIDGYPVATMATVPGRAVSLWPCLCGARNRLRDTACRHCGHHKPTMED